MRKSLTVISLLAMVSIVGAAQTAAADTGPQITQFDGFYVVLDANVDAPFDLSAHLTAGTNPITSASVAVVDPAGTAITTVSLVPGANAADPWTGSGVIPWETVPGTGHATLTVTDGMTAPVTQTVNIGVLRKTKMAVALSPATPHVGARYSVVATVRAMVPGAPGNYAPLPGASVTFRYSDLSEYSRTTATNGSAVLAAPLAAPYTGVGWSASYGGSTTRMSSTASVEVTPTRNVTRIVSFDAGPEPAYRHAYITISGTLQYDDPNAVAWRPYGGKTIRITRGSYATTAVTDSTGHFTATKSGISSTVGGIWHATFDGTQSFLPTTSGGDEVLTTTAPIRITRAVFDSAGNDNFNLNGEYVTITNRGIRTANIYGWTLRDRENHVYTVTHSVYVAVGHSVNIHTGSGTDTATNLYWGQGVAIWGNDGDTAYLKSDLGASVDSCNWTGVGTSVPC